jgi:hypothetical protein
MRPSIEIIVNGIPTGAFSRFAWHRDGRYLLKLIGIDVSCRREPVAVARYAYFLEVEKHSGYTVVTVNLFGKSWLIHLGRNIYVQRINQETEE